MKSRKNNTFFNLYPQFFPDFLMQNQRELIPQNQQIPQIPQYRIPQLNLMQIPRFQYQQPQVNRPIFNPTNNANIAGNFQNPIYVGSDSDDDDVVVLDHPPVIPTPPPSVEPLPKTTISVGSFSVKIPEFPKEFLPAFNKALEMSPKIQAERVSTFLEKAARMKKEVDNLVKRIVLAGNDTYTVPSPTFRPDMEKIVLNFYPNIYTQDIKKIMFNHQYDLLKILDDLPSKALFLRKMKTPHLQKKLIEINDIVVSIYLIEYSDKLKEKQKELDKKKRYEEAVKINDLIECECCCNEYLFEDMAQCPEGHLFCKECLNREVQTLIGEGRSEVRCLSHSGCDKIVSIDELTRCVDEKIVKQLFIIESQNAVAMANLPGLVKCYKCGFEATIDDSATFHCPECQSDTCPGCGEAAHPGISCEAMKKIDKDRFVEEKMNEAVIRVCPKCKAQFMKEDGCNKMECPRCHTWICYWCRKEIPKEVGYDHFWRQQGACPPDKCPLWVQNNTLHEIEAEGAKEEGEDDLKKE